MTHEEYKAAANHWNQKDATSEKMPKAQLLEEIDKYIQGNNTCALATGYGDFIRCTPIEYSWHNESFWMFSEGGQQLCRCITEVLLENRRMWRHLRLVWIRIFVWRRNWCLCK